MWPFKGNKTGAKEPEHKLIMAFDYEGTATREPIRELLRSVIAVGHRCLLVAAFDSDDDAARQERELFCKEYGLDFRPIVTDPSDPLRRVNCGAMKGKICRHEKVDIMFENDLIQARMVREEAPGTLVVYVHPIFARWERDREYFRRLTGKELCVKL